MELGVDLANVIGLIKHVFLKDIKPLHAWLLSHPGKYKIIYLPIHHNIFVRLYLVKYWEYFFHFHGSRMAPVGDGFKRFGEKYGSRNSLFDQNGADHHAR